MDRHRLACACLAAALAGSAAPSCAKSLADLEVISFEGFAAPEWGDPAIGPFAGTRELAEISPRYKPPIDDYLKDPGVGYPSLESVRENIEAVSRLSLKQYREEAQFSKDRKLARRLKALSVVAVRGATMAEDPPGSMIFRGKAVFHDASRGRDLDAEIIGDFSDPHWHLSQITLFHHAAEERIAEEPAPAPPPPEESFDRAVRSHIREASRPGRGYPVRDGERGEPWQAVLLRLHTEQMKDLGEGQYEAPADFVDVGQRHELKLDFFVRRAGDAWRVERGMLVAVDGRPRAPAVEPPPFKP